MGRLLAHLDELVGGSWVETSIRATITASSVLAFPGLGRQALVANQPPKQYRVRLDAELYRPFYRATSAGIIMSVPPYNDTEPQTLPVPTFGQMLLLPAFHYQYPSHIPVVRGEVVDTNAVPVADALVVDTLFGERTLTDERGAFSLPAAPSRARRRRHDSRQRRAQSRWQPPDHSSCRVVERRADSHRVKGNMAEYLSPGVYIEEVETGPKPIEGVSTSTTGFVGVTVRGPTEVRQRSSRASSNLSACSAITCRRPHPPSSTRSQRIRQKAAAGGRFRSR